MRTALRRLLAIVPVMAVGALLTAAPAPAALSCAPDPYEPDGYATAASIAPGTSLTRAICQEPTPMPRTVSPTDYDWFGFDAPGGTAYTAQITAAGPALGDGLVLGGVSRVAADGSRSPVVMTRSPDWQRISTGVLDAGRYAFFVYTNATEIYPGNIMDVKTVDGPGSTYSVALRGTATSAPTVTSLTLSPSRVKGGRTATGTVTLSAPAPPGGVHISTDSTSRSVADPQAAFVPAGSTSMRFSIPTVRVSGTQRITISVLSAADGERRSAVLSITR